MTPAVDAPHASNGHAAHARRNGSPPPRIASVTADAVGRVTVEISANEHEVNEAVVSALSRARGVYKRAGFLSRVVLDDSIRGGGSQIDPRPRTEPMPLPSVREAISECVRFTRKVKRGESYSLEQAHPPDWCVKAVYFRGDWPTVPTLSGVSTTPILRADGSVVTAPGYDPQTATLYVPIGRQPSIPAEPTRADVDAAVGSLLSLVVDFPFARPEHRSAWLAALLSIVARSAYDGSTPLFLVDGNVPGAGKGLLTLLIGLIVFGAPIPADGHPSTDDEFSKRITTWAIAGRPVILIDNIANGLGCPSLDRALTAEVWGDRLLGQNSERQLPMRAVWLATGNNCDLRADTARRVCHVRLESPLQNPEDRGGFQIPDLAGHVRSNRAKYLADALTILRGWYVAGRPKASLPSWGSFEGWSGVVRQSLVWAGQPDPWRTREVLVSTSDREAGTLAAFVNGWEALAVDLSAEGRAAELTAGELLKLLEDQPDKYATLRTAVEELAAGRGGTLSHISLGKRLAKLRGRVRGGRAIDGIPCSGVTRWTVREVGAPAPGGDRGDRGDSGHSSTHPRTHAGEHEPGQVLSPSSPLSPRQQERKGQA